MRILPVLDLLNGTVVHGIAGHRDTYRPIRSDLCDSPDPLAVARAFRDRLGLSELYVADLDAIEHGRPNTALWRDLVHDGFSLLIDAGSRDLARAETVLEAGASAAIAGLETLPGPALLEQWAARFGSERVVFSLDLREGTPLGNLALWPAPDPLAIATEATACGVDQFLVLDLSSVGTGTGPPTLELCRQIARQLPLRRLITGGGIRDRSDLDQLAEAGVTDALVATALHAGRLGRD